MSNLPNIKQSVAAIIFDESKQKLLVIKRRDVPMWVLPGGGVDPGETPAQAVVREVFEETGRPALVTRQIAKYLPINRLTRETHLFECSFLPGQLSTGPETSQVDFFSLDNLPTPFFFIHKDWLQDALKNDIHLIVKPLSNVTYLAFFKYFCCHPLQVIRFCLSRFGFPINN